MTQVNIAQAKAQLSELVQRALAGEEVIIARGNKPLLRLIPLDQAGPARQPGTAKGLAWYMADDFDAALDDFSAYR
ncbi:type II toxin-antitoxin system Phd/YefM family antitoxin [Ideonella sp.]|jgi:prevent-host-death family protein|uniref:type II toxin-antitoxin system Phd/YefM family antitoxin n=1 Tax=Ideonella sp. TaxID=1929293 RepID=UPI0037C106B8